MISVSKAFKQAVTENREYLLDVDIELRDGTQLDIAEMDPEDRDIVGGGLSFDDAVSSDSNFDIGAAIINRCTLALNNMYDDFSEYDFTDARVVPWVGLRVPGGTVERVRKGTFTVDDAKYNGSIITLTCLDAMARFDKPYSLSSLTYPATLGAIVRDACDRCGVPLQTYSFPHSDHVVEERPSDEATTFREVISWAAQIACCFCRCDVYGRLELKWYDQEALEIPALDGGTMRPWTGGEAVDGGSFSPWTAGPVYDGGTFGDRDGLHHIYALFSMDIAVDDVVITGARVVEKTGGEGGDALVTYQSGTDGYVVSIEGNGLIQGGAGEQVADWIGERLIGFRFRRASASHLSDPTIEAGDVGLLSDRKGNTYRIVVSSTKFKAGAAQSTSSSAQTPARNSATRFSADTKNYVENRKHIEKEQTDREKALADLKKRVDESPGLFMTKGRQENGSDVLYMHDKPLLSDSMYVWKLTAEVWAVSTDGGETYNAGISVDGDMIARILTVMGVKGEWVDARGLTVRDSDGAVTRGVDARGRVTLNAGSLSLAGKGVATEDHVARQLLNADNLLEDAIGLGDTYWTYAGKLTRGQTDPAGGKDAVRLQADGTDCYLRADPSSNRPLKASGRAYEFSVWLRANAARTKIKLSLGDADGLIEEIEVGTTWKPYTIRTTIGTVTEGSQVSIGGWESFTASSRSLYIYKPCVRLSYTASEALDMLTDNGAIQGIFMEGGKLYVSGEFVQAKGFKAVNTDKKTTFYVDENGDVEINAKSLKISGSAAASEEYADGAVAEALDGLGQEEILDKLTNGGTDEGIYLYNKKLYISFSAARGGTLTLGGSNNTSGALVIKSSGGAQIGAWDKDGIVAEAGTIGGFTLGKTRLYGADSAGHYVVLNKGSGSTTAAIAVGGSSATSYSDAPFRVTMAGKLYATGAEITGKLTTGAKNDAWIVVDGNSITARDSAGHTSTITFPSYNDSAAVGKGSVMISAPNGFYVNGTQLA